MSEHDKTLHDALDFAANAKRAAFDAERWATVARQSAEMVAARARTAALSSRERLIFFGTVTSSVLVFVSIILAAIFCFIVIEKSFDGTANELVILLLISCIGCFIAMALACLGFALFLIQAQGDFSAGSEDAGGTKRALHTTAPGLVVIICATAVVWISLHIHFRVPIEPQRTKTDATADGKGTPNSPTHGDEPQAVELNRPNPRPTPQTTGGTIR